MMSPANQKTVWDVG